jgi:hypothetical protein
VAIILTLAKRKRYRYTGDIMVKQSAKQKTAKKTVSKKVSYEPNKVGLAVAIVAVVSLVLIAIITTS